MMIPEIAAAVLKDHGLTAIEFEEGSTPTAPRAAEKLGVEVGQIAKSIFMKGKDGMFYMVVCPGDRRISASKLKRVIGVKARMATPEETLIHTGYRVGGVCPFGLKGISILLDNGLKQYRTIYPAAGTDASGVPVSWEILQKITGGSFEDVTDPIKM